MLRLWLGHRWVSIPLPGPSANGQAGAIQAPLRAGCASQFDKAVKVDNFYSMTRLTIEIEPEQHRQIKTLATFSGMTIKEFILSKTLGPQRGVSRLMPRIV
jgi:hypothetical protein